MERPSTFTPSPESHAEATHSSGEVFSQSAIEAVRATQKETYYLVFEQAIAEGKNISEAKRIAEAASILSGHDYLDQYAKEPWLEDGIDEGYQVIDKYSFTRMSDTEWISAERDDEGSVITPSGINQLHEDRRVFDTSDTTPPVVEADPRQEALKDELNDLRDKLTTLSAKRQGSLVDFSKERYDEALKAYNAKFIELARLELSEKLSAQDVTPAERNALVVERFFNEQQELRKESREKMKHTHVGKFVEWFTGGSRSQRFLRAGLVGAGAATIGVIAGGVVGGVVGTAAVATGAAAAVTGITRFAKAYAKRDNNEGRGLSDVEVKHKSKAERSAQFNPNTDVFESVQTYFGRELEGDTKKEKLKRLRSVAFGLGAVAVGGTAATAIAFVAETGIVQQAYESTKDFITSIGVDAQPSVDTPTTYADDLREPLDLNANQIPKTHGEVSIVEAPVSDPNFTVGEGQGGIQFFQEKLGLNESQWYEVAGELRNNFPNEFYTEGYDVRIQNSGQLSIEAQQFIKNRFGL